MKVDKIIALIKERVSSNSELPGWKSHKKMAVIPINSITEKAFIPPKDASRLALASFYLKKIINYFFANKKN